MAPRSHPGEDATGHTGPSRGVPPVRHHHKAAESGREGKTGDTLPHAPDKAPSEQPTGLCAVRGQAGVQYQLGVEAAGGGGEEQGGVPDERTEEVRREGGRSGGGWRRGRGKD